MTHVLCDRQPGHAAHEIPVAEFSASYVLCSGIGPKAEINPPALRDPNPKEPTMSNEPTTIHEDSAGDALTITDVSPNGWIARLRSRGGGDATNVEIASPVQLANIGRRLIDIAEGRSAGEPDARDTPPPVDWSGGTFVRLDKGDLDIGLLPGPDLPGVPSPWTEDARIMLAREATELGWEQRLMVDDPWSLNPGWHERGVIEARPPADLDKIPVYLDPAVVRAWSEGKPSTSSHGEIVDACREALTSKDPS